MPRAFPQCVNWRRYWFALGELLDLSRLKVINKDGKQAELVGASKDRLEQLVKRFASGGP